jgi:hypothetical protein
VEVLVQVISALFDINPSMNTHMAMPLWKRCVGTLLEARARPAPRDTACSSGRDQSHPQHRQARLGC